MRLLIVTFITLLVTSVTFGQRTNSIRWQHLNKSVRDSIHKAGMIASDTTTLKTMSVISDGTELYLTQTGVEGAFIYQSSGYTANGVTVFASDGGGYLVRKEWIDRPGFINVRWAGAVADNSTDNTAAINRALFVLGSNTDGELYFPASASQKIYRVSSTIRSNLSGLKIRGDGIQTRIKLTTSDTLFVVTASNGFALEQIRLTGPGQNTNSIGVFLGMQSGGVVSYKTEQTYVDSFGVGYETSYLSGWTALQAQAHYCGVGFALGDQGDALTLVEPKMNYCDTAIVIGADRETNGEAPIKITNIWTQTCGVDYVIHDRNHLVSIDGWYSENADTLMILEANGGSNYVEMANGHIQQLADVGIVMAGGFLELRNIKGTISSIDTAFVIMNGGSFKSSFVKLNSGTTPGGRANNELRRGSLYYSLANDVTLGEFKKEIRDANGTSDFLFNTEMYNGNGGELQRFGRVSSTGSELWNVYISDLTGLTAGVLGVSKGGVRLEENAAQMPTASADYKGLLWHWNDKLFICVDDGGGGYKWANASVSDTTAYSFYGNDIDNDPVAGWTSPTQSTINNGYKRIAYSFADGATGGVHCYTTPIEPISDSDSIYVDIFWFSDSLSHDVVWGLNYGLQETGAAPFFSALSSVTATSSGTAKNIVRTRLKVKITSAIGTDAILIIRIRRVGADASDSDANAYLQHIVAKIIK